jgi:hypothetical protein
VPQTAQDGEKSPICPERTGSTCRSFSGLVAAEISAMRQAIEEGFIPDVLRNYTAYKLAQDGKE